MFFKKKIIGIDIGSDAIKVVEISVFGNKKRLENYGEVASAKVSQNSLLGAGEQHGLTSPDLVSQAIKAILREAKIKTKKVVFSIPDFLTFSASFEIPPMSEKEIPGAVYYNASHYLTLPVSEVTLDWRIIKNAPRDTGSQIKVFLVAVPNEVIKTYQEISKMAGLELYAIEAEVFSITRALCALSQKTACLIDMGAKTSTINIVDKGFLKRSYSLEFSSSQLSKDLSSALGLTVDQAEEIKNKEGMVSVKENVSKILKASMIPLFAEIQDILASFFQQEQKQIDEILLTGGAANIPGLKEYVVETLKKPVSIPNCFFDFIQPSILKETIKEMSPRFSAAVGAALTVAGF